MNRQESKKAAFTAVNALEEKKGVDVKVIDISDVSTLADYFVIASGTNDSQIQAMVDSVQEKLAKEGFVTGHIEGFHGAGWTLLDYADVVIHIFDEESRKFYDLERIWKDGKEVSAASLAG